MKTNAYATARFSPLCDQELENTRGGIAPIFLAILAGAAVAATSQIIRDWENFKAGLAGRPPVD